MSKIGLIDVDGGKSFPNIALMKISAWHKAKGDAVGWWIPLLRYDRVYSSKVFTFTPENPALPEKTVRGGTGYSLYKDLPGEVESAFPDYSLYPACDYAVGFLTRGCIRNCPWCVVPRKEGRIRAAATWREIKRADSRKIVFMDNNVLAHPHGIAQMEDMIGRDLRIDFNQGIDARLITPEIADMLGRLKWISFVRMACDTDAMLDVVLDKVKMLGRHGVKPYKLFVYCLVQDIESAERRCIALREAGCNPFAQPYRDFENNTPPRKEVRDFARWVNQKAAFKSCKTFAEYNTSIRGHNREREKNKELAGEGLLTP